MQNQLSKKKLTWYEKQQRRRQSLFRLIDQFFWMRLLVAAFCSLLILVPINRFEKRVSKKPLCKVGDFSGCLLTEIESLITVANVEAFSIVTAALLFVIERGYRRQQEHFEAWRTLDYLAVTKVTNSQTRRLLLQSLNEDGVPLKEIEMPGINLSGINLAGADLTNSTLANTNLVSANLSGADLTGADLAGANLTGANLREANLTKTNLVGADLTATDLTNASLHTAILTDAKLNAAILTGTILEGN